MAKVRITTDFGSKFPIFLRRIEEGLYDALAAALADIVQQAAITARALTARRGRPTSNGSGRIDTGAMVEAIKDRVQNEGKRIIGEFGFTEDQQDYYIYQTVTGFTHWLSGEYIPATLAIRDASIQAEEQVRAAIKAAIRSVR